MIIPRDDKRVADFPTLSCLQSTIMPTIMPAMHDFCDRIENFHWQTNTYIVNRMSINLLIIGAVQRRAIG